MRPRASLLAVAGLAAACNGAVAQGPVVLPPATTVVEAPDASLTGELEACGPLAAYCNEPGRACPSTWGQAKAPASWCAPRNDAGCSAPLDPNSSSVFVSPSCGQYNHVYAFASDTIDVTLYVYDASGALAGIAAGVISGGGDFQPETIRWTCVAGAPGPGLADPCTRPDGSVLAPVCAAGVLC